MSPDAPWIERALFHGLHLHNSWLFLPATSLFCFVTLLLLIRNSVKINIYRLFLLSFGILPLLVYSAKDVSVMVARASLGYGQALKYAYLVLGLPTLILFVVAAVLLATDRLSGPAVSVGAVWPRLAGVVLVCALSVVQSLWLFEADASL